MFSELQAGALGTYSPETGLSHWASSLLLSQPSLCKNQAAELGYKRCFSRSCLITALSMDTLKMGTVAARREALQSNPLVFSSTCRAPVSEAARAENTALHQRHRDRQREREKSYSLTGKGCDCPTPDRLLRGAVEEGGKPAPCSEKHRSSPASVYCGAFRDELP